MIHPGITAPVVRQYSNSIHAQRLLVISYKIECPYENGLSNTLVTIFLIKNGKIL